MAGQSGFGEPWCDESVGFSGVVPASLPVEPGLFVLVSYLVGSGGIVLASFSVGTGKIILASFSVGVLVPSSYPSLARSIKIPTSSL